MAERPSDWSALGYDSDPTPGDPQVVMAGGQYYVKVADSMHNAATVLRALDAGVSSGSQSVQALLKDRDQTLADVAVAEHRYRETGETLIGYAYVLDRVQGVTYQAWVVAKNAREAAADSRRLAELCSREATEGEGLMDDDSAARYAKQASAHSAEAAEYDAQVEAQKLIVQQAVADRDAAANQAMQRIQDATSSDGLNDSWWDDWGAKVVSIIAAIAEWVSTIAGILALLVCWIPIIGQALAGVLFAIAAVAAIVAALANIVLAATGEKSWTEAIVSIIGAALACVGLAALKGAFSGLKGAMGAWKAAGGLAGQGGLAALMGGALKGVLGPLLARGAAALRNVKWTLRFTRWFKTTGAVSELTVAGQRFVAFSGMTDPAKYSQVLSDALSNADFRTSGSAQLCKVDV